MTTECHDFSYFKEQLRKLRKLDDSIPLALNNLSPVKLQDECASLFQILTKQIQQRQSLLSTCLSYHQNLKQKHQNEEDDEMEMILDNKIRLIKNEIRVEEILIHKSLNQFHEKCRVFEIPEEYQKYMK